MAVLSTVRQEQDVEVIMPVLAAIPRNMRRLTRAIRLTLPDTLDGFGRALRIEVLAREREGFAVEPIFQHQERAAVRAQVWRQTWRPAS